MNKILSKEQIKELFLEYKNNKNSTTEKIAKKFGLNRTTIGNYFKAFFGAEYKSLSRLRSKLIKPTLTKEEMLKISLALKGKPKPQRTLQHRINLSKAMSKTYVERFGEERAKVIKEKIGRSHLGRKRAFKNKELWKINLSNSLKGREVWNKGKRGLQKAWNKKELPAEEIINMYLNKNLSSTKIAKEFDVDRSVIMRILKENKIKIKGTKGFIGSKTYEEIHGKEKASELRRNLSRVLKGHPVKNWAHKISIGIKRHYEECRIKGYKISRQGHPLSYEHRLKLSIAHKKYLKEHPEELDRLRMIQYPGGITEIEQKMLDFLRENFKEGEDFYFDKQDSTGKTFYRPDFQFPKQKVVIELDGYYKHFSKEGYVRDKIRAYYLKKAGWNVYRFNFYDIDRGYKFKEVKNKVMSILRV